MRYKTIVLELLQQNPALHDELKASGSLLSTMERMAVALREDHLQLLETLRAQHPTDSEILLRGQAMELVVDQLRQSILQEDQEETE
jgi:hypothetical protein